MFDNFHLAAITGKHTQIDLRQIPLSDKLSKKLSEILWSQYNTFVNNIQEIDFDPGYQPEEHERFCLCEYELPNWLEGKDSLAISNLEKIRNNETQMNLIKGLAAFARNEHNEELILFQNFTPSQIIQTGFLIILAGDTYTNIEHPGLTLGKKLSAVYYTKERKLLFHSFYNVNIFLPLSDYFKEASEQDIRDILSHEKLMPENPDALAVDANQWFRKRFAILKSSNVLDKFTAREIRGRSKGYDVSIQLSKNNQKIVFPSDKSAAKRLLQFLNEEILRGPVTGTLYEINSKKPL